jgi:NADH:ubiquinone oxidoreductase subunit B-like Fe-S oxidoreductase
MVGNSLVVVTFGCRCCRVEGWSSRAENDDREFCNLANWPRDETRYLTREKR